MKKCNKNLLEVLQVTQELLQIADKGDIEREDSGCGVLFGIVRDSAYKIKAMAEMEIQKHKLSGRWNEKLK